MKDESQILEEEKTYKIYNYMKKHHSLLIASVSAVVAVASLITNVLVYVYQCIVLQNWNVSMELVGEVKHGKYFYIAILGALYYFCVPIYQMFIKKIINRYYYFFPLSKIQMRANRKLYRLNKPRKIIWKEVLDDSKKNINAIRRVAFKKVFGAFLGASLVLEVFLFLFQISLGNVKGIYLLIASVFLFVALFVLIFFTTINAIDKRKIEELKKREQGIKNSEDAIELLEDINKYQVELSSFSQVKKTMKEGFCDKTIGTFIELMVLTFACLCFFFVMSGFMTAKTQKSFWIYQDEGGKNYAVIYQNEEKAIMKEVEIKDDTIVINLDKQLTKILEGNPFEYI